LNTVPPGTFLSNRVRQEVKPVTSTEINILSSKIASLNKLIEEKMDSQTKHSKWWLAKTENSTHMKNYNTAKTCYKKLL
jgi:hypothetical protein